MQISILRGKIHRCVVTEAQLNYVGSITIDSELVKAAGFREYERIEVVNVTNGARWETYIIAGKPGSGMICVNGGGARMACVGDKIIIMSYAHLEEAELESHKPNVVFVDDNNKISRVTHYEEHGQLG